MTYSAQIFAAVANYELAMARVIEINYAGVSADGEADEAAAQFAAAKRELDEATSQ